LKKYIGEKWVDDISAEDLVPMDKSFILKDYKDKEADVIYRVRLKGSEVIFYVLLELQSSVDFTMSFRLLLYMTELLRREFMNADKNECESKEYRLPAVIPIVLYNGSGKWTALKRFKEYQNGHEIFGKQVIDFEYLLFDLKRRSEASILATNRVLDNIFALDQKEAAEEIARMVKITMRRFGKMEAEEQAEFMDWVRQILLRRIPEESDRAKVIEAIEKKEEITMQYGWDRAFDKERIKGEKIGEKKGEKIGEKIGAKNQQIKTAEKLLAMGLSVEQVAEGTELSKTAVIKIKKSLKL
jgi:predicted transposase/invertase (TIGR01784 family)